MRKSKIPLWPRIRLLRDGDSWMIETEWPNDHTIEGVVTERLGPLFNEENAREEFQDRIDLYKKPIVQYKWSVVEEMKKPRKHVISPLRASEILMGFTQKEIKETAQAIRETSKRPSIRQFKSGATRDTDDGKLDWEIG